MALRFIPVIQVGLGDGVLIVDGTWVLLGILVGVGQALDTIIGIPPHIAMVVMAMVAIGMVTTVDIGLAIIMAYWMGAITILTIQIVPFIMGTEVVVA